MRTKKITYRIHDSELGSKKVKGHAIDWPLVRLCARKHSKTCWRIDHFDSGLQIMVFAGSKKAAIAKGVAYVSAKILDGSYAKAINELNARQA